MRETKEHHHTMDSLAGLVACEAFSHDVVSQTLAGAIAVQADLLGLSFLRYGILQPASSDLLQSRSKVVFWACLKRQDRNSTRDERSLVTTKRVAPMKLPENIDLRRIWLLEYVEFAGHGTASEADAPRPDVVPETI